MFYFLLGAYCLGCYYANHRTLAHAIIEYNFGKFIFFLLSPIVVPASIIILVLYCLSGCHSDVQLKTAEDHISQNQYSLSESEKTIHAMNRKMYLYHCDDKSSCVYIKQ
jgi:hypothetical protein